MASYGRHGLRGSALEDMINHTNDAYRDDGLALIQKVPTPITPVDMNEHRQITLAYFERKSTVDYIGLVQGVPVCFDAKECAKDTFPLQNVHEHQISFMRDFERQGGVAFFIMDFTQRNEIYYMPFSEMDIFWKRMINGGRKSFRFDELNNIIHINGNGHYLCHYLAALSDDLDRRALND